MPSAFLRSTVVKPEGKYQLTEVRHCNGNKVDFFIHYAGSCDPVLSDDDSNDDDEFDDDDGQGDGDNDNDDDDDDDDSNSSNNSGW